MISINFNPQTNVLEIRNSDATVSLETLHKCIDGFLTGLQLSDPATDEPQLDIRRRDEDVLDEPVAITVPKPKLGMSEAEYAKRVAEALEKF